MLSFKMSQNSSLSDYRSSSNNLTKDDHSAKQSYTVEISYDITRGFFAYKVIIEILKR